MAASAYDRARRGGTDPAREKPAAEPLELASAVGNAGMQRMADSAPDRALPVGSESLGAAAGRLSRQADESEPELPDASGAAGAQAAQEADQGAIPIPDASSDFEAGDESEHAEYDADQ